MMNQQGKQMTEFENQCYGMSEADIREEYMEGLTARLSGLEMVVMGILSDCQEMVALQEETGDPANLRRFTNEYVRKQLNRAKFILCEMSESKVVVK
jgi:hypothetical protein